jgi:hypothetical protein
LVNQFDMLDKNEGIKLIVLAGEKRDKKCSKGVPCPWALQRKVVATINGGFFSPSLSSGYFSTRKKIRLSVKFF